MKFETTQPVSDNIHYMLSEIKNLIFSDKK